MVWHRMLYSCTHMAKVSVKGLNGKISRVTPKALYINTRCQTQITKNLLGRDCIFVPTGVRKANASLKNKLVNQYHNISITMHPCV